MSAFTPERFVRFLLPHLVTAGRYARQIQRQIQAQPAKAGETAFQQALSDADLSVQAFLEVVLLSRFPEVSFFSEEQDQSLNLKYFPREAEFEVLADPIDGTRAYLDGAETYQIIVTLRDKRSILAALCYMPRTDCCYVGIRGKGATVYSTEEMEAGVESKRRINLSDQTRRIVAFNAPQLKQQLGNSFEVLDVLEEYKTNGKHYGFTELFEGKAAACAHPNPQVIDAGAISFIAQEAGGILTNWAGESFYVARPAAQRLPGLIVSASKRVHDEILRALQ
jgi:myo-inositol-1(or 4)-monophosphatase